MKFSLVLGFRAEYECFQIELAKNYGVPEWREDLKKVLLKSGVENKSMVFLFSDTQVTFSNFGSRYSQGNRPCALITLTTSTLVNETGVKDIKTHL